ncbi:bacterial transcriptional activator domain-containing protein [Deinococcus sp. SM5_A1]|uniref:bacterial transcriptional activator domain-containing protein n=1 Tax=Deinococcus sp. SM5_A1 TaxID=3379094 RepID=UPI00385ED8AF
MDVLAAALHKDPLISERWHQDLMIGLAARDRYAAVEHYRRYVRYLRAEVGDTPMQETTALAQRIKDGLLPGAARAPGDGAGFAVSGVISADWPALPGPVPQNPVLERWGRA